LLVVLDAASASSFRYDSLLAIALRLISRSLCCVCLRLCEILPVVGGGVSNCARMLSSTCVVPASAFLC